MKTMKLWRLNFGLWPSHLTLGKVMQASLSSRLIGAFMMIVAFSLASCEKDRLDGDWDSMVWKAEVPVVTNDGIHEVSDSGGTLTFSCRNYSGPWISGAVYGEEHYYPERENKDYHTIMADWFKAEIVGNKLTVFFEPNKESSERFLSLTVTAGDIFYTFKFKQYAHQK